jgi:hypothetical protein
MRVHDSDWDNLEKTTAEYMANPDMEAAVERHRSKYMKQ